MRTVDAYGLENDTPRALEIWARCDGVLKDPNSGDAVFGAVRVHEPLKSSVVISKGIGWSDNRLTDIVRGLAFFAPTEVSEGREFQQTISRDGVKKRDTV
jgi:hypothetical protein